MALDPKSAITWYGHSCVEIATPGGVTVLIDPWFANPNSPRAPDAVDRCDVMVVTHSHFDHFGDALAIASRTRPTWPAIHELSLWLGRNYAHKDSVIGMNKGGTVDARGVKVTMTHADHSAGDIYGTSESPIYLGEPVGVVLELESGYRLFHAGDTALFSDLRLIAELYRPELAMLPIGGHFTMGPREAAMAVEWLGVKDVLPLHYGTFPVLAGTPDQLRQELAARGLGDVTVHAPEPGGRLG
ncbi:MAG TPA: metal-dependent hydrolase [Candidatus Limnocylindrales bacterium]|jgi:L-ascorbate metabolism protein UlaG (beta-lactamase superfamily)|nr:metal-dependent hydrolase [Candidatus Limnocylindrales bacterium]